MSEVQHCPVELKIVGQDNDTREQPWKKLMAAENTDGERGRPWVNWKPEENSPWAKPWVQWHHELERDLSPTQGS